MRNRITAAVAAGLMVAALGPVAAAVPRGPGCTTGRLATATRGGAVVSPAPTGAPVPCEVKTGYGGAETRIAVTPANTLVYEPATLSPGAAGLAYLAGAPGPRPQSSLNPGGLAVSRDAGATWDFVKPAGLTWVPQDDQLYVDRTTGRIFYYALSPNPVPQAGDVPLQDQAAAGYAHLMESADGGATWTHTALAGFVESENPRFATAPPPAGQARPANDPDVAYWCGNNMLFAETYRACYRSLDGGLTWAQASILFSQPVPQHPECGTNAETFNAGDGNYPQPAPGGALYVVVSCGNATFLARSDDEGASWPILTGRTGAPRQIPPTDELRVDERGTLYSIRLNGAALLLRVSTDAGDTWGPAVDLVGPGVTAVNEWYVAERGPEIAVAYLGHTAGRADWDGYIGVVRDGRVARPILWTSTINDPSKPLYVGSPAPARDDFVGVDIGPDGTPWGAFFGSCPAGATDPACAGQSGDPLANAGVVGRLAWPR